MKTPTCKRRFRNCGEFGLCINIGDSGYVLAEDFDTFQSIFLYVVKGNGKIGKMFKTDYLDLNQGKFYDIKDYINDDVIFKSDEEFYLIGFNNINQDSWEGRLLGSDETKLDLKSIYDKPDPVSSKCFIVCFDGNPSVNGKQLKRFDYSEVVYPKEYNVSLNGGAIGFFTKTS